MSLLSVRLLSLFLLTSGSLPSHCVPYTRRCSFAPALRLSPPLAPPSLLPFLAVLLFLSPSHFVTHSLSRARRSSRREVHTERTHVSYTLRRPNFDDRDRRSDDARCYDRWSRGANRTGREVTGDGTNSPTDSAPTFSLSLRVRERLTFRILCVTTAEVRCRSLLGSMKPLV